MNTIQNPTITPNPEQSGNLTETPLRAKSEFKQHFLREQKRLTIPLDGGMVVTFLLPQGSADYIQTGASAQQFVAMCQSDRCPPDWKPFIPDAEETISQCFWISKFCESITINGEPVEKMTQADWLEMGKTSLLTPFLYKQLAAAIGQGIAAQEVEDLEHLKED